MTTSQLPLSVVAAQTAHRPVLEQLWAMFRHDMSAFNRSLPDARGRFRQERLDTALHDPDWAAYLFQLGHSAAGLAIVRGLDADERIISSFFLVHGARRAGHGRAAARAITRLHPGRWAAAYQDVNAAAARFWAAVAFEADERWTLEHRAVPGRPDLPPDAWARFTVEETASGPDP
ncbi:GNAT family N-acetyltransferase [Gryllotalpicola koreensis]|uniref:GNAT family N-acetyltransferase n=1 Tax=Gryllotalpicola koreensis TaxID=993086 RepID=A0ABP8A3B7_9MICO